MGKIKCFCFIGREAEWEEQKEGQDGLVKTILVNLAGTYYNVGKEKNKILSRNDRLEYLGKRG